MWLLARECRGNTGCFAMCFRSSFDLTFGGILLGLSSKYMSLKRLACSTSSPGNIPRSEEAPPSDGIVNGWGTVDDVWNGETHARIIGQPNRCEDMADLLNRTLEPDDNRD